MLVNVQRSDSTPARSPASFLPPTLKQNVVDQAASMLLRHLTLPRSVHPVIRNSNGNALDERRVSPNDGHRKKREFRRTSKCRSWLSYAPLPSETSLAGHELRALNATRVPSHQPTLSANAVTNDSDHSQGVIVGDRRGSEMGITRRLQVVRKKRIRRDVFLSTMQCGTQPPSCPNHLYAFDEANMLKLQRDLYSESGHANLKRKHADDELDVNQPSPFEHTSPQTAGHISMHKYRTDHDRTVSTEPADESHVILGRLEKILGLCGELRSIARDVELHLTEHSVLKPTSTEVNEDDRGREPDSEATAVIDIYKELEQDPLPAPLLNHELSSVHSESTKSIQLMQTESFKTKSPSVTASQTKLRTSEEICSCFLKSFLDKNDCQLTVDEQEYLNELTKAYVLGREHVLREQKQAVSKEQQTGNADTNNNNQSVGSPSVQSTASAVTAMDSNQHLSSSTSLKHQSFLHEPIAMKATDVLPGIGRKYAEQLEECGFSTVRRLLGLYLMIKDDQHFVVWLNSKAGVSIHSAWQCVSALRAWCQTHI